MSSVINPAKHCRKREEQEEQSIIEEEIEARSEHGGLAIENWE